MIVRVFRARVHPGNEDEFERLVIETGVPMVNAAEGCTHVTAVKSRWNEQPEFVVVT
jgi:quinol monooxygenase YgiN